METNRILIVDDEAVICNGCQAVLSDHGFAVDTCMSGQKGLDNLLSGKYELAFLDIRLPDMDGMELLRCIRQKLPGIYVIMMTGYASVENAVNAMKSGAFDYITKPFSDDELLIAAKRAIENKRLKEENTALRQKLSEHYDFDHIIGEDPGIQKIFDDIQKVAPTDSTVLLYGESGTGKELFARAVHSHSNRSKKQFVAVDCGTFSSNLLESELFGHVKGAFTGAVNDKPGIFSIADQGSLFLDEVANLDMDIQAKLLRAMETGEFKPVGASRFIKSDVRIITASNRDLKTMVEQGEFREDFFYRLHVFPIFIPPLRQRKSDIPRLLYHFLKLYCRQTGKRVEGFSDEALEMLINYEWPGNVRELKNMVERLVIITDSRTLDYENLFETWKVKNSSNIEKIPETLQELKSIKKELLEKKYSQIEKAFLEKAVAEANGNIAEAARRVGMQRSNLSSLLKKHGLSPESFKTAPANKEHVKNQF